MNERTVNTDGVQEFTLSLFNINMPVSRSGQSILHTFQQNLCVWIFQEIQPSMLKSTSKSLWRTSYLGLSFLICCFFWNFYRLSFLEQDLVQPAQYICDYGNTLHDFKPAAELVLQNIQKINMKMSYKNLHYNR